jgi:polyhydroxyalkanoate synthesis regulator phasin
MSDEKNKVTDKAGEIAKNIWLAGVGAYGKAVEDAQGRIEKAMEPPKLFKDLVKAGSALEEDAREAIESSAAARKSVEDRIARVRENFHLQRPARIEDLEVLLKKVDRLEKQVANLTKALEAQGLEVIHKKPRAAAKKKAAARPKAKAKGKTPANKKVPAKKPPSPRKKSPVRKR